MDINIFLSYFILLLLFLLIWAWKTVPDEVWICGTSARVLDLNNNYIRDVPVKIGSLSSMQVSYTALCLFDALLFGLHF